VELIKSFYNCPICKGERIIQGEESKLRKSKKVKITKQSRAISALSIKIPIFYNIRICRFVNRYRFFGDVYWNQSEGTARRSNDSRQKT
jgi:hypothetical protein